MMTKGYYRQERVRIIKEIIREHGPISSRQIASQLKEDASNRIGSLCDMEVVHILNVVHANDNRIARTIEDRHYVYRYVRGA